eukprot:gnl/TRDRNA2_/TRDRNA2_79100_c1_seq1.p1 gnl/TRDRNA2_/TRDRNA2_79100_c1~~gnl/TRDRNA2_/TRDRNA2_79100_c1_seq1.p1  ORF type:complete len:162 (+),score=32.70 gnl/TRDRNA2_/TRDRNA2_79100_c1_seq1:83-568(+)
MSIVTGGLGGLGLIASSIIASEGFGPIITTSRAGRPSAPGPVSYNLLEAIQQSSIHISVKGDVGNSAELNDLFAHLSRPAPDAEKVVYVEQMLNMLHKRMHTMPPNQLQDCLAVLQQTYAKYQDLLGDLRNRNSVDPGVANKIQADAAQVSAMINSIQTRL